MIRRPPRSTLSSSSAASDVYKRQVPDDRDRLGQEPERDGPLDRLLDAVAGLADAVGLGFLVGGLDRPAAVVARDQLARGGVEVGAGQGDVEALVAVGLA